MKTALIAAWKLVNTKNSNSTSTPSEVYLVTTVDGDTVWVPKSQFDTNAESISFKPMKKGEKYTTKDGAEGELKADRNEYLGCGKQVVKKFSATELIDHMSNKGIQPSFSLQS